MENILSERLKEVPSAFDSAIKSAGEFDRYYDLVGNLLHLRFAGSALTEIITPALEHLEIPAPRVSRESTVIGLFDSSSTGVNLNIDLSLATWENWYYEDETNQVFYQKEFSSLYYRCKRTNLAFYWTQDALRLPCYIKSWPLVPFFHWWLSEQGFCLLHASSVGNDNGAVLLVGNSGAGKSTSAFACLESSLQYISDDRCLLALQSPPYVYSLYNSAKLNMETLQKFPYSRFLASQNLIRESVDHDCQLFLHRVCPERIAKGLPLKAILTIRLTGDADSYLSAASASQTLLALAPSTILRLPGGRTDSFRMLSDLVKRIPAYCLHAGTKLEQIPSKIESLLNA